MFGLEALGKPTARHSGRAARERRDRARSKLYELDRSREMT
jgi:hypothetical protein